jgi:hypothetical protein
MQGESHSFDIAESQYNQIAISRSIVKEEDIKLEYFVCNKKVKYGFLITNILSSNE